MIGNQAILRLLEENREGSKTCQGTESPDFGHDFSRMPVHTHAMAIQPKLTVSEPDDHHEQEADRVADQVMRMPEPKRKCTRTTRQTEQLKQNQDRLQTKKAAPSKSVQAGESPVVQKSITAHAATLDTETRNFMEPRFGYDFSDVRIHSDGQAVEAARSLNARAFTVGNDIVFGEGQYRPRTDSGRKLLAHELTHVYQQRRPVSRDRNPAEAVASEENDAVGVFDRRKAMPVLTHRPPAIQKEEATESRPTVPPGLIDHDLDLTALRDAQLHNRFDQISQLLAAGRLRTSQRRELEREGRRVGDELSERALRLGLTFHIDDVEQMKQTFLRAVRDARAGRPHECINLVREALGVLMRRGSAIPQQPRNEMQGTMEYLNRQGSVSAYRQILFVDARGTRITRGIGLRPERPEQSVWTTMMDMARGSGGTRFGYSVFGLSLLDNFHSVVLTIDNRPHRLGHPIVRWSDQTTRHGRGWEEMQEAASGHQASVRPGSPRGLDEYVRYFTQTNWDSQPASARHWSIVRLWLLRQAASSGSSGSTGTP
jgi:hypothetical protein